MTASLSELELVSRYDRPGPRYTSYPTAMEFHEGVDEIIYAQLLSRAALRAETPLSLYLHLPFCRERCDYCGCNVVISKYPEVERRYRELLLREVRRVAERLGDRRGLSQLAWGGGTPTFAAPEDLATFHREVLQCFDLLPGAEVSVEVDPRVTRHEHLAVLAEGGFNRLSMGVQDFDRRVQAAIGRRQDRTQTEALVGEARRLGFRSINVDLVYGLPHQTLARFERTLGQVVALRPERIAVYGYAHLPERLRHQGRIDATALPDAPTRLALSRAAARAFQEAGWVPIGLDHFALPEDELARAAVNGRLGRNFMGYTVHAAPDLVACGLSAIGDVEGAYVQNEKSLARYQRRVEAGGLATARGIVRDREDRLRGEVIAALMTGMRVDRRRIEVRHGVDFATHFEAELERLAPLEEDGLVRIGTEGIEVVGPGRRLVRNVALEFDAYRRGSGATPRRFSRTV